MRLRVELRRPDRHSTVVALFWAMLLLYAALFSTLSVLKHQAFQTTAFDLGNMDQAVWNSLHGRLLPFTNWGQEGTRLAYHVDPILVLISPLYLIYSDPRTLLVLQSILLALGALPIFLMAQERLGKGFLSLAFPLAYLLFPALEAANLFDFHPTTLVATFAGFAFYFLWRRRYPCFFLFAILTMTCKEDMPLLVFMMGLYALLVQRQWRVGTLAMALAVVWFTMDVYVIIPRYNLGGKSPYLAAYSHLGEGPLEILRTIIVQPWKVLDTILIPEKLWYLCDLLAPMAFLSLLAPQVLLLSLPTLGLNLLSANPQFYTLERFQYAAPLVPFVVFSALLGTVRLAEWLTPRLRMNQRALVAAPTALLLVSTLLYHRYHGFTPLAASFRLAQITPHHRLTEEIMALIPKEATVSAQSRLNPHLSQREKIYMFPKVEDAEYVFFDVTADSWPIHPNDQRALFESLIEERGFGILAAKDGYILLKRGLVDAKELPDEFYDFARVEEPQIEYPMVVDFAHLLRFLGFDLHQEKGLASLTLYWQALAPLERDYRPYPFFYNTEGRIIEDTTLRPMTTVLWYPTSKWKVGEVVQMKTLPWEVGEDFRVGLGVLAEGEWPQMEERLPLEVVTSTLVVSPFDGNTALELLQVRGQTPLTPRRLFEPPPISHPLRVNLDHKFTLLGYDISPETLKPGDGLHLTLYWQALTRTDKDYTVFVHLFDEGGLIRGQKDGFPAQGTRPTSGWIEGEIVVDEYTISLPKDAPRGRYTLAVGMYDLTTGERLATFDVEGVRIPQDRVVLTTLEAKP